MEAAVAAGAVGVKLPVGANPIKTRERIEAALATGLCPVATDLAWSCRSAKDAFEIVRGLDLAWVEDPFIPGSIAELVQLRRMLDVPLASGDDETHLYHPQVFIETGALDILRIDATCQGGLSRMILLNDYMEKVSLQSHGMSTMQFTIRLLLLSIHQLSPSNIQPLELASIHWPS